MKNKKKIIPLPFPIYFWTVLSIVIVGLIDSIYLLISHYRVYVDIGYKSFCAVSRSINCDTVSQSPYSIFLNLPLPVWGIFGYSFILLFMPLALSERAEKKRLWAFFQTIAFGFCVYSLILALISTYYIHSYCIMCIVLYGVNLLILYYTWLIRKRFSDENIFSSLKRDIQYLVHVRYRLCVSLFLLFIILFFLTYKFFPHYWTLEPPVLDTKVQTGITDDMHPWIGAVEPELVIEEFADYQCFQCKKMHFYLRQLVAEHPEKIKLIHYQYPMDNKFNPIVTESLHENSGKLALIANHAILQEKFWEVSDYLFQMGKKDGYLITKRIAQKTGLDHKKLVLVLSKLDDKSDAYIKQIHLMLQLDILKGMRLGITGTPAYVINGQLYQGIIPPDILKTVLNNRQ